MKKWLQMKEPVNTWTHLVTCLAAIVGLILLIIMARHSTSKIITMTIYGVSVIMLFAASTIYHWAKVTPRKEFILRKIDHIAIYFLIAGSYTPILYYGLEGRWRSVMLTAVWILALVGLGLELKFKRIPRAISTSFYLTFGWLAIIPFWKFIGTLPMGALVLMFVGGLLYTIGGVIYGTKKLDLFPQKFGFHEIFHIFISLGTLAHFLMIAIYIVPL